MAGAGVLAALGHGCASQPSYYEVRLVQPNQYNRSFVQSADKPVIKQGFYIITDGKGGAVPLEKALVQSVQKRPLADIQKNGSRADHISKVYELKLVQPNPFQMQLVRSAEKPTLNKDGNYVVTDDQGATYLLPKEYVLNIETRSMKDVRKDPPQRLNTAPGKGSEPGKPGETNFRQGFGYR
jgi:hypothetical protein